MKQFFVFLLVVASATTFGQTKADSVALIKAQIQQQLLVNHIKSEFPGIDPAIVMAEKVNEIVTREQKSLYVSFSFDERTEGGIKTEPYILTVGQSVYSYDNKIFYSVTTGALISKTDQSVKAFKKSMESQRSTAYGGTTRQPRTAGSSALGRVLTNTLTTGLNMGAQYLMARNGIYGGGMNLFGQPIAQFGMFGQQGINAFGSGLSAEPENRRFGSDPNQYSLTGTEWGTPRGTTRALSAVDRAILSGIPVQ